MKVSVWGSSQLKAQGREVIRLVGLWKREIGNGNDERRGENVHREHNDDGQTMEGGWD